MIPGFDIVARVNLKTFLPPGRGMKPTLCVSDTHLVPHDPPCHWDAPKALLRLLRSHPDHQVFLLGDIIESLVLRPAQVAMLHRSKRLRAVVRELQSRRTIRVIPGNHDARAVSSLVQLFGRRRVLPGGFRIGRVVFSHGHENKAHPLDRAAALSDLALPLGHTMTNLGVRVHDKSASNEEIASWYRERDAFVVFGHTHEPAAQAHFANTGCFLSMARSFITIHGYRLELSQWRTG